MSQPEAKMPNRLQVQLERLDEAPVFMRPWVQNFIVRRTVPLARTIGLEFRELSEPQVTVRIKHRPKVANHEGDIHNSALQAAAEAAASMVMSMNVRDHCRVLPVQSQVVFHQRAQGNVHAVAQLSEAQRQLLQTQDDGEFEVAVKVTDEAGQTPVTCHLVWAWKAARPARLNSL